MTQETKENNNPFIPFTFKAYGDKAMSYRLPSADATYALLMLPGEVGELLSLFAKARRDGIRGSDAEGVFKRAVKKEIGDCLWGLEAIARDIDSSLEECGLLNLVKLRDRAERGTLQGSGDER